MKIKLPHKSIVHIILILLLGLIAYSNTFKASFQFDDIHGIVMNESIRDLNSAFEDIASNNRYVTLFSFALNYRLHGLSVAGYHIANFIIHISTSLLLYYFVLLTFRLPSLLNSSAKKYSKHIAVFTALLFACHPIQTEAVTYIWQRSASLATMFYLLSLVSYIKWRLGTQNTEQRTQITEERQQEKDRASPGSGPACRTGRFRALGSLFLYLGSLLFALLAMKTKEISFTLPLAIVLYESLFFKGNTFKRVLYLIPLLLTMLIIPLSIIGMEVSLGDIVSDVSRATQEVSTISRMDYFFTELRVLVTYLRLIFLPINQNLDYDYPLYRSLLNPEVFFSFVFLLALFALGIYLFFRYRDSASETRLISFGIFWFFLILSVESSFIPIRDVIFEHRMYLPSVGVFISLTTALFMLVNKYKKRWQGTGIMAVSILSVIIIALSAATYARNSVWHDELSLWQDVVSKSPNKSRGHNRLGTLYMSNNLTSKAINQYKTAIKLNPDFAEAYNNLGYAYYLKGSIDTAIKYYQVSISLKPYFPEGHKNIGLAYFFKGSMDKAVKHLELASILIPDNATIHLNLAIAYKSKGLMGKAEKHFKIAQSLKPSFFQNKNIH